MPCYGLEGVVPQLPQHDRYWIAPNASVIGRVKLEIDVSIWFGAVLRGDNDLIHVGQGTNIQDHAMLHTDTNEPVTVGAHCTVGHHAILHACTVEDGSLIGMGAVVLNRARIGRNCLVGAKALVTEGREIPGGSLVLGSPAKVVRSLDEREIAQLKESASSYVRNWRRYARGLAALG